MNETSKLWRQIAPSDYPWEHDALAFIRQGLPDHEPYRAWANLEFVAEDGTIHEVDLLVLAPKGFFLIEIRSWDGTLEGDTNTWRLSRSGRTETYDSPLLLANRKARKLASLLKRQKAARDVRLPYLEPLVFLSSQSLQCKLTGAARQGVHLRDRESEGATPSRPGILAAITRFAAAELARSGRARVDRPLAKAVTRALEEAGIRPTQRSRRVGDYILEEMIFAGPYYQDWQARHISLQRSQRRIRIYPVAMEASAEARTRLERAAHREMEALEPLSHPGILKPLHLTQHELGPALLFEHDPKALRLDHFMAREGSRLGFGDRLDMVRQLAETLQYAHDHRLYHRSLSPSSVQVWEPEGRRMLRILDWQTAAYEALTTRASQMGLTGTSHLDELVEDVARVYAAPEALTVPDALPESLDVFSLGALAFFLFSGRPPAATVLELHDQLKQGKGLQLASALDGVHPWVADLVQQATHPVVAERLASVTEILQKLEEIEDELTKPEEEPVTEIQDARKGDRLPGGFLVKSRLGKGSTSVVFLVERDGKEQVLKVALDSDADERLRAEARALRRLDHPRIVQLHEEITVGERVGLLLARAGDKTVAHRLREEGRFQLEFLQRFGEDLLQAVHYLERTGVPHRDIKPDNLGLAQVGRNDELHLLLFDFSLAGTSAENIFAGTRQYLDPFLRERKPRRWDLQAERFAAAVTLYEMATGTLPRWGDGQTDPLMLEGAEARVEAELLDAAVRAPLSAFFTQALRRDPRQRFDNAEEMLAAWRRAFEQADRPTTTTSATEEQPDELARACEQAELETPVSLLHLSTRAVNALERAQVVLVKDLLRLPVNRVHRLRGVGSKTRKELVDAIRLLSQRFEAAPAEDLPAVASAAGDDEPTVSNLDLLVRQILPSPRAGAAERWILEALFGLSAEAPRHPSLWPSQTETAEALHLTRARVSQVLGKARERWLRNPSITLLRDDIARMLETKAGAMTLRELFAALLVKWGSAQEEPQRTLYAAAALRAADETEDSRKSPRWLIRRAGEQVFFALTEPAGGALLDAVETLGRKADLLAAMDPLPSPQRSLEVLQSVPWPLPAPLSAERLLRLATGASRGAALSSRLEIYPRDLAPERALRLASGALLGAKELSVEEIRARVSSRYPEMKPLPGRPELDDLLTEAGLSLEWTPAAREGRGTYTLTAPPETTLSASSLHRAPTTLSPQPPLAELSNDVVDARIFEERLDRSAREGAFLALVVPPRALLRAEEEIASRFPVERVSLEERWLEAMERLARENEVDWGLVLRADAETADLPDAQHLRRFAARALEEVERDLSNSPRTILLSRAGLLARYGRMDFLERLRERVNRRPSPGETGLHGLWLLVPSSDHLTTGPEIDGEAVPVLTRAQWASIPEAWLENRHRSGLNGAASSSRSPH